MTKLTAKGGDSAIVSNAFSHIKRYPSKLYDPHHELLQVICHFHLKYLSGVTLVMTSMNCGFYANQFQLITTGFVQFFFQFQSGYFAVSLYGHGHSLSKMGPKTMTGLDHKALITFECTH
jgi:hypothetical protein